MTRRVDDDGFPLTYPEPDDHEPSAKKTYEVVLRIMVDVEGESAAEDLAGSFQNTLLESHADVITRVGVGVNELDD
jgi:hypothetical protein